MYQAVIVSTCRDQLVVNFKFEHLTFEFLDNDFGDESSDYVIRPVRVFPSFNSSSVRISGGLTVNSTVQYHVLGADLAGG